MYIAKKGMGTLVCGLLLKGEGLLQSKDMKEKSIKDFTEIKFALE